MKPVNQAQHRTPQVLLKQFGYQKDGKWYVLLFNKEARKTEEALIEKYNAPTNEFDYPDDDFDIKRHYEDSAGRVEAMYRTVLNSITHQFQLIPRHEDVLRHLTASLIVRAERPRHFFTEMVANKETRSHFLQEIMMFEKETKLWEIDLALTAMEKDQYVSLLQGYITNHIVWVLRGFKVIILEDFDGRGWMSADDPVCINAQDNYSWIIPLEAEIYLPLSPKYCAFFFHDNSERNDNPLRKLAANKIHPTDETAHFEITQHIIANAHKTLIIPSTLRPFFDELSNQS
jgi:hypothetical protein